MSTFTKEQLIEKLQHRISVASGFPESEKAQMDLELARIALSTLEAEPVAYIFKHPAGRLFWSLTDESNKGQSDVMSVYTAQPAPVFVPDCFKNAVSALESLYRNGQKQNWNERYTTDMAYASGVLRACRAAMLQGADGNSPVIPEGWVLVPEEPTHEMLEAGDEQFGTYDVYRRMIAASPQQEVKP
ncbi:hypothetical protein KQJ14_12715 [Enterobacteriaceae bacterium S32_ASV_15]|nr:hypothetical protein [Enterobacteriaceae bacterium S32_ASV_15]